MAFRTEAITVLPAIILFVIASYLAFLTCQVVDSSVQEILVTIALYLFLGGLVLAVCWAYYWGTHKRISRETREIIVDPSNCLAYLECEKNCPVNAIDVKRKIAC